MSRLVRLLLATGVAGAAVLMAGVAVAAEWVLPLARPPIVTRPFDLPSTPYGPGHRGVDLAGAPGQQVRAAGAGTIGYAAPLAGRGVVTVVHDGGLRTTYEPVTAAVVVGEAVAAGAQIGVLQTGHRGCPAAACLHWGLRQGEIYLDPMSLLSLGPIRLLPSSDSRAGPGSPGVLLTAGSRDRPADGAPGADAPDQPSADEPSRLPGSLAPAMTAAVTTVAGLVLGAGILLLRPHPP